MTAPSTKSEIISIDENAKIPQRRDGMGADPVHRITTAISRGLSPNIPPISEVGYKTAFRAMATNSKIALAGDLDCYVGWCINNRRLAFPADPEVLVKYLDERAKAGAKPATLARRIASIARAHKMLGIDKRPTEAQMVIDMLKAGRVEMGTGQRQAAPLRYGKDLTEQTSDVTLTALLEACDGTPPGLRNAAMLSAGYDAGLRVSELIAIQYEHIDRHEDGTAALRIPKSKTDQEAKGASVWLSVETIRRINNWLEASGIKKGPIFRRIAVRRRKAKSAVNPIKYQEIPGNSENWQKKLTGSPAIPAETNYVVGEKALTRQAVSNIYRKVAEEAWNQGLIDVKADKINDVIKAISTHSLRVGLTQDMFDVGAEIGGITAMLRWTSGDTALRYNRNLEARSGLASQVLGKIRK